MPIILQEFLNAPATGRLFPYSSSTILIMLIVGMIGQAVFSILLAGKAVDEG